MFLKNYRKITLIILFSIYFSSCKKEADILVKDTEEPEIIFQALQENVNLKGEIEVNLTSTDNKGISKVEVYINNTILAILTQAPYIINWNTRDYLDGAYILKAIAYDNEGNKKEVILNVNVLNTLLKVNTAKTSGGWAFIADIDGKTLGVKKFNNGDVLEFQSPDDFDDDRISLSIMKINEGFYSHYNIETFLVDVSSEITLESDFREVIGTGKLTVNNFPEINDEILGYSPISFEGKNAMSFREILQDKLDIYFNFYQSPINGLLSIQYDEEQAPKYKLYENLESGKLYEVDYNELPSMTSSYEYEFPVDGFFYLSLDGIRTAGDISKNYFIRDKYTSKDKIYYPEGIFSRL